RLDFLDDFNFFVAELRRDDGGDWLPNDFLLPVTEDPLGAFIPALDNSVQILADNSIVGRFHDGCKTERSLLALFLVGNVSCNFRRSDNISIVVLDGGNSQRDV